MKVSATMSRPLERLALIRSSYGTNRVPLVAGRMFASRALSAIGLRHPWLVFRENPPAGDTLPAFKFFAILGTWMEEDVVGATVKNAFAQGCDRVFLVDNDSPDDTVVQAVSAGAELVQSFSTDIYDEVLRIRLMNEAVLRISAAEGSQHIWWLWIDADEFPHGPRGLTVRQFLSGLDRQFRIVGAQYINHYPDTAPYYRSAFHPLDFQPLCEHVPAGMCWLLHNSHPLRRFDRGRPVIGSILGLHRAHSSERPLVEPTESIFVHHFPFREKDVTLRRLRALFRSDAGDSTSRGDSHKVDPEAAKYMNVRLQSLEAVYSRDWAEVCVGSPWRLRAIPVPWPELVALEHVPVRRWYDPEGVRPESDSA